MRIPAGDKATEAAHGESEFGGWLRHDSFVIPEQGGRYPESLLSDAVCNGL
jgi:hypothetical protein